MPIYLSISFIGILIACYFAVPSVKDFFQEAWQVLTSNDESRIRGWIDGFGWVGPLVIILAMVAQMFLLVIPSILLMVVAILSFGPIWGAIISLLAVALASTVGYLIGKYLGKGLILRFIGERSFSKVSSFLERYGFWAVAITRVNPFLSNDAISFVAGILKMNYFKFISATLLGISPLLILIAWTGKNTETLKSGLLWGSAVCLLGFGIYIFWDKKMRKSK